MALSKEQILRLYRKRAGRYDLSARLYYLLGFPQARYRRKAVAALSLDPGDAVVEIGCGTGLNFPLLEEAVGPEGRIVGVDLTDRMLEQAGRRAEARDWSNVELVRSDAAAYRFPDRVDGILSTFAITLVPEYERVIERGRRALAPGGRLVVLDFKLPEAWPAWLVRLFVWITRPFGVTLDLAERKPYRVIQDRFASSRFEELYFGSTYLSAGEVPSGHRSGG